MKRIRFGTLSYLLAAIYLAASFSPELAQAKGYSSGGGHSYSSHSSSHSSGGGSHSFSSGSHNYSSGSSSRSSASGGGWSSSSSRSSGSSKSFSSGGKSYSAGSSRDDSNRHGYSSGKSYGAGSGSSFSPKPPSRDESKSAARSSSKPSGSDSGLSFDTAAARARKEESSKADYTRFKDSKSPPIVDSGRSGSPAPSTTTTRSTSGSSWDYSRRRDVYVPDVVVIQTRPRRVYSVFGSYYYRPWVTYSDPYSSLFWWWLLDRSIDDQAWWAYHHRYDMDPARYQALLASNQQLEARVAQLEGQQVPRDPAYTPTGLDRDLMYSDHYVDQAYHNRPTRSGSLAFWIFGVPIAAGSCAFLIWLIWFKRWQTAT